MRSLTGGACQDNYLVDLKIEAGDHKGDHRLVMRTDKGASLLASLSRIDEFGVCELAFNAGVKTPRPLWLEPGSDIIGNPFYFMERIGGSANGRFVVKDASINQARKVLPDELAASLARIHSVTPDMCKDADLSKKLSRITGDTPKAIAVNSIGELRKEVAKLKEAHPALELILNWLEQNAIPTEDPVLVHGDFRTGNFMVAPEGLQGIVDWEFAHWGDRHEDVSWLCMKDWRFGKQNKEVGGFTDRETFYAAYAKHSGVKLDPRKVLYWEIMGNARWACGSAAQAERHLSGMDKGIELASIGRRSCEMQFEAMRLIDHAG
ncbi:MAG: phosphotransferase family protein [Leptospirales bacterium]|nr:phosphotransferase family protein [Leptospirales bacterium]